MRPSAEGFILLRVLLVAHANEAAAQERSRYLLFRKNHARSSPWISSSPRESEASCLRSARTRSWVL